MDPMETDERVLPLFPLERVVLFPRMSLRLHVFEERYRAMINACAATDNLFGVLLIRSGREVGGTAEPERVGCTARITELVRLPDGRMNLLSLGEDRFRLTAEPELAADGYLVGRATLVSDRQLPLLQADEHLSLATTLFHDYQRLVQELAPGSEQTPIDPGADAASVSFQIASTLLIPARDRQALLEIDGPDDRLRRELDLLRREIKTLRLMAGARPDRSIGPFSAN
jgi:Lon protease-like protein